MIDTCCVTNKCAESFEYENFEQEKFPSLGRNPNKNRNRKENGKQWKKQKRFCPFRIQFTEIFTHAMRPFLTALSFIFAILTVHGTKVTNTTPVDSAKTGGQTFLCNHYAGEDPKTHQAIKKLDEKLEAILKLLQGNAPPISPGEKR